ncbi:hypothetical protein QTP88_014410 [Uroleucon formosanum]
MLVSSFVSTKQFLDTFLLGTADESYHVEKAWNEGQLFSPQWTKKVQIILDLPKSIIKKYTEESFPPTTINDGTHFKFNGDVPADTYHKTDIDIKLLKKLGISLHHYDMEMAFNKIGGLANLASYIFYTNYTRIYILLEAKGSEYFVPGYQEPLFSGYSNYQVLHLLCITTHIMVYKLYNDEFKEKQRGKISITIDGVWFYPKDSNNPEHQKTAECERISTAPPLNYLNLSLAYLKVVTYIL